MPKHEIVDAEGKITHLFAHRFVLQTARGAILADLTPEGLPLAQLRVGDEISISGEMKPSELKVRQFTLRGKTMRVPEKKHHHHDHHHSHDDDADPRRVLKAARDAGFETVGEPRRKPKHFEVLGKRGSEWSELHIEFDGHIRKTKPVHDNHKWIDATGR